MFGLMQDRPLMISSIIRHAAKNHASTEIVSKLNAGDIHRTNYAETERRARRLVRALQRLGVKDSDRVATLAWNGFRHLELYYAISGMGAVCHTLNPRLAPDDIAYIVNHAADSLIFADVTFVPLIEAIAPRITATVRAIVLLADRAEMPALTLPPGMDLLCYEDILAASDEEYDWPEFDERTASSLCYTSGTTGKPKGVLYSHRSTLLHAYASNTADAFNLSAVDRVMPVVPMFHVNAWGISYAAPMVGSALIYPGRHLDGASVAGMMNDERVTISAGVPTIWMGLLQYLRSSGARLDTVRRLTIGGSACPRMLLEAFGQEYGVTIDHAWGMSETSPLATYNRSKASNATLDGEDLIRLREKQGRMLFGIEVKIIGDDGAALPWDAKTSGNVMVRGAWVASGYYGQEAGSACDADGWFTTGDVATICPEGYLEITDRSKDVIKSGGEWISSIQLENIAVSHPDVMEAAIIAARHPKWDERPLLLVVAKEGRTIDKASVMAIYQGKVAKWWLPDEVIVVDELPHTATGKLSKLALRTQYRDYLINQTAAAE